VLPHVREVVIFMAVPLTKNAAAETLGGIPELLGTGAHWAQSAPADVVAGAAEGTRLDTASTTAEVPAGAPQPGKLDIAGAAAEDGDAVTVMVLLTVSVTVNPAAQPGAPPAGLWKAAAPDGVAGTTVIVSVVVVEILMVVVGSTEVAA
jgi:hypothetical protein